MVRLIILMIVYSFLLSSSQVTFKYSLNQVGEVSFNISTMIAFTKSIYFWATIAIVGTAFIFWVFILKNYDLSIAYPLTAISYIFGLLFAIFLFKENVPMIRWLGVIFIITGIYFVVKK